MSKASAGAPADKLALYEKLVATNPSVERKGATMPYTSAGGHMFSFLTPEGKLALRLPEPQRSAFLQRYQTKLCEQHGVVMKEYVEVPDGLLKKTAELKKFFDASYAYVSSLPPKGTKGKKNSAATAKGTKTKLPKTRETPKRAAAKKRQS